MTCQLSWQSISLLRKWPLVRIQHESPFILNYVLYLGRLAQLVERYPYKVDVISSSLISTTIIIVGPIVQWLGSMVFIHVTGVQISLGSPNNISIKSAVVVQLVRISACHAEGREFESRQPRHFNNIKKNINSSKKDQGIQRILYLFTWTNIIF